MRTKHILPVLAIAATLFAGCYREQDVITPASNPVGGKGGRAELRITPKHFDETVDTCVVFIKYDAVAMPKNRIFDDSLSVTPVNGSFQAVFDSLKQGNYFFYARGYDFTLVDTITGVSTFKVVNEQDTIKNKDNRPVYNIYMNLYNPDGK